MAGAGVGARAGVRASKTVLKICCKLSSEYLEISVVAAGGFSLRGLAGYSENSDLEDREESRGAMEEHSQQK